GIRQRFIPADPHHGMIGRPGRELTALPVARAGPSRPIAEPRDARPDLRRPDLQRIVAAGLDEPLILPVADRVTVQEAGAEPGVGITPVTEDDRDVAGRDHRHLLMQQIPGGPGVTVTDLIDGVLEQDEDIAVLVDQAPRHALDPLGGWIQVRSARPW